MQLTFHLVVLWNTYHQPVGRWHSKKYNEEVLGNIILLTHDGIHETISVLIIYDISITT